MSFLEDLRNEYELSMMELGRQLDMADTTISRIEKGQRPISRNHIDPYCKFFDVSVDCLLGKIDKGVYVWHFGDKGFSAFTFSEVKELHAKGEISYEQVILTDGKYKFIRRLSPKKTYELGLERLTDIKRNQEDDEQLLDCILGNGLLRKIVKDLMYIDNVSDDNKPLETINSVVQLVKNSLPKE
jgi:transcriptional regulator with XRE-family HTH domain